MNGLKIHHYQDPAFVKPDPLWLSDEVFDQVRRSITLPGVDVIIQGPGRELMLALPNTGPLKDKWVFPGRIIRPGERIQEVAREVLESLGVTALVNMEPVGLMENFWDDGSAYITTLFWVILRKRTGQHVCPNKKYPRIRWVRSHNIVNDPDVPTPHREYIRAWKKIRDSY